VGNEMNRDGDMGFVGLNSRDNPSALPVGIVNQSKNFRLDRGVATVRKGLQRKTLSVLTTETVYGSGVVLDSTGQELIVVIVTDGLFKYNPQTETISAKVAFPAGETITSQDGVDFIQAIDYGFISRGFSKRPLVWDLNVTITVLPTGSGSGHEFPSCTGLLYYSNRIIALACYHTAPTARQRDTVSVSNFLDHTHWGVLDAFTFNNGGNDEVVSVAPWTMNEFLVFMRNSIFYVNVGNDKYTTGDALSNNSFIQTMSTDTGCVAKRSVVQVNGGVMFLSDNGVYFLKPNEVGAAEGMRLTTLADPISAPIDDVIQTINKLYSSRAVGIYWGNRYYLAVPIGDSTVNNKILVYNFILKQWESVDEYPAGFNACNFIVAKKDKQRRLYAVDKVKGIFLMEQLEWDEYGVSTGTPILPFYLPATLSASAFTPNAIDASLKTRRYTFNDIKDKRYSSANAEMLLPAGSQVKTYVETLNPDTITLVDTYGSPATEDSTRRNPARKIANGIQIRFDTNNLRPSIRAAFVDAVVLGKTNSNKE
jgi:hypothetical protein